MIAFQIKKLLQLPTFLSLHDSLNNVFCRGFTSGQVIDAFDNLGVGFPFVLKVLGPGIVNVVLFGQTVQTIDPGVSSC